MRPYLIQIFSTLKLPVEAKFATVLLLLLCVLLNLNFHSPDWGSGDQFAWNCFVCDLREMGGKSNHLFVWNSNWQYMSLVHR